MNQAKLLWANLVFTLANIALLITVLLIQPGADFLRAEQFFANNSVRVADERYSEIAGGKAGQGSITLFDHNSDKKFMDIGFYEFGAGVFTPTFFEVWSKGVAIASHTATPNFQIRNKEDTRAALWMNGEGYIGAQDGPIYFGISRPHQERWDTVGGFNKDGTFSVVGDISMQGQSLTQRLRAIESKLGLIKQ